MNTLLYLSGNRKWNYLLTKDIITRVTHDDDATNNTITVNVYVDTSSMMIKQIKETATHLNVGELSMKIVSVEDIDNGIKITSVVTKGE